jgi:hypothetical protein
MNQLIRPPTGMSQNKGLRGKKRIELAFKDSVIINSYTPLEQSPLRTQMSVFDDD